MGLLINLLLQIIWYGAWLKKSYEDKESLTVTLVSLIHYVRLHTSFKFSEMRYF